MTYEKEDATVRTIAFALSATLLLAMSPSPQDAEPALPPDADPIAAARPDPPMVVASYFGPGLWDGRTACGRVMTDELIGVAHRTLPCGTLVTLRYGSRSVTVPVVDRGPFNFLREFDLTFATKAALGCPDLCRLHWVR